MNKRIKELAEQARNLVEHDYEYLPEEADRVELIHEKFAELIIRECLEQVEQAKNSPFVSLDDAKRMSHFVDVTKKNVQKHFGVE